MAAKSKSKCELPPLIHIIFVIGLIVLVVYIGYVIRNTLEQRKIRQLIKGDKFLDVPPPTPINTSSVGLESCAQIATRSIKHIVSKVFGQEYNIEYVNDEDFIIYVNLSGEATLDDDGKHVLSINGDKLFTQLKDIDNDNQKWRAIRIDEDDINVYHIIPLKSIVNSSTTSVNNPLATILGEDHPSNGLTLQFEHGHLSLRKMGQFENQYWFIQAGQKRFRNDKFHVQTFVEDPGNPMKRQLTLAEEHQEQIGNILYLIHNNIRHYDNIGNDKGVNAKVNDNSLNLIMDLHGLN